MQDAEETIDHPTLNRTIPHGEMPQCKACGECFSNWDRILEELQKKTNETVGKATKVKVKLKLKPINAGHFLAKVFYQFTIKKFMCLGSRCSRSLYHQVQTTGQGIRRDQGNFEKCINHTR